MMPEEEKQDEPLFRKDISSKIQINNVDAIISDDDIQEKEHSGEEKDQGDHPFLAALDMAVETSEEFIRKEGLPAPNTKIYTGFSRPFLNKAMWHYLPEGDLPDDPKVALALGAGGLALAYLPTLLALNERRKNQEREEKKEKSQKENPLAEAKKEPEIESYNYPEPEGRAPPALPEWSRKLENRNPAGL